MIDMEKVDTVKEKVDVAGTLVAQMYLAYQTNNREMFMKAHERAGQLLFDAVLQMEEEDEKIHQ